MKKIFLFIFTSFISVIFIAILMIFIFNKPFTIGWSKVAYNKKYQYYSGIKNESNPIIIVAGSNGIFSHSCAVIESITNRKCINYAVAAGNGIGYILEKSKEVIVPGATVVLPLEYGFYSASEDKELSGVVGNVNIIENDPTYLTKFGLHRFMYAIFSKNLQYVIGSIIENMLYKVNFKMRFNIDQLNKNGDMTGHTISNGAIYTKHIEHLTAARPESAACLNSFGKQVIIEYINYVHQHNGEVYGALPTTFNSALSIEDTRNISCIRNLYLDNGAKFIDLSNNSMYSRESFYDTFYHLNQEAQIEHSKLISKEI